MKYELYKLSLLSDSYFSTFNNKSKQSALGVYYHSGCGISPDERWIMWGKNNLLRLIKQYEPYIIAVRETTVVLGYLSGMIIIIDISMSN